MYFFISAFHGVGRYLSSKDMTENDKRIVDMARSARSLEEVFGMEDLAETEEARRAVHDIAVRLYHEEEYAADML